MVKLLMRFHDLKSGKIYLDGKDITEFARGDPQKRIRHGSAGHVALQRHHHGEHPLRPLGRDGRGGHSGGKAAQVDHFVRTLPDGYNTILNEEATNVSQGTEAAAHHRPCDFGPTAAS